MEPVYNEKYTELETILKKLVLDDEKMTARHICRSICKPYPTMLRETNVTDRMAKLGVVTMFQVMEVTGNVEPLRWMANHLGYEIRPSGGGEECPL